MPEQTVDLETYRHVSVRLKLFLALQPYDEDEGPSPREPEWVSLADRDRARTPSKKVS
jgi:hypothetical protein